MTTGISSAGGPVGLGQARPGGGLPSLGGGAGGGLPSLGGGASVMGGGDEAAAAGLPGLGAGAPATGTPGASTDPNAQAGVPAGGAIPDMGAMMAKMPAWLGPLVAIGGAGLAIWGMKGAKPSMFKIGSGAMMGLSGLWMTASSSKARGREEIQKEATAGILQLEQAAMAEIQTVAQQKDQQIAQLTQQLQMAQQSGAGSAPGSTPGTTPGTAPGTGGTTPGAAGTTPGTAPTTTPGTGGTQTGAAPTLDPSQWSASALIGQAVTLGQALAPTGAAIAESGSFKISSTLGDPNGYATFEEADAAAQSTMSTDMTGTKLYRWLVIEHGGRYYAFQAMRDEGGMSPQLPSSNGNVVGWHALRFDETGAGQWTAYHWSTTGGSRFNQFTGAASGGGAPVGTGGTATSGSAGGTGGTGGTGTTSAGDPVTAATNAGLSAAGTPPAGAQPARQAGAATGGGPTAAAPQKPAFSATSLIGTGFQVNAASVDGKTAAGGFLQLQKLVPLSEGGFATPAEAGSAAREYRAGALQPTQWQRWVTVKAADGRYYVFEASIVSKATSPIPSGSSPMHVYGHGFAEYYDGKAWVAQAD